MVFKGEQEKESIIHVRYKKNLSLGITICHHSASLVMPNGDPRDVFLYPTLKLIIDSYDTVYKGLDNNRLIIGAVNQ